MEIIQFEPNHGRANTEVKIELSNMPENTKLEDIYVQLNGQQITDVFSLVKNSVSVRIGDNPQSGQFSVVVQVEGGEFLSAVSSNEFTVEGDEDSPSFLSVKISDSTVRVVGKNLETIDSILIIGPNKTAKVSNKSPNSFTFIIPSEIRQGDYYFSCHSQKYGTIRCPKQIRIV